MERRGHCRWRTALRVVAIWTALAAGGCDGDDLADGRALTDASTTTLDAGQRCSITWGVTNSTTLGLLEFDTDYSAAPGGFEGAGDSVACSNLVEGVLAGFSDDEASASLWSGMITLSGFDTPRDVTRCDYVGRSDASRAPRAEDFVVTVTDAMHPGMGRQEPVVEITSISCGSTVSTTTTTLQFFQ
jgi:hypothetical protein